VIEARTIKELFDYIADLEEKQRRLDEAGAPIIGIFYVVDGKVYHTVGFCELVQADPDGIRRASYFESLWRTIRQFKSLDSNLYTYPRGRVVYIDHLAKFVVYADVCLLERHDLLHQVIINFNLVDCEVEFMQSLDYKFWQCHEAWGIEEGED